MYSFLMLLRDVLGQTGPYFTLNRTATGLPVPLIPSVPVFYASEQMLYQEICHLVLVGIWVGTPRGCNDARIGDTAVMPVHLLLRVGPGELHHPHFHGQCQAGQRATWLNWPDRSDSSTCFAVLHHPVFSFISISKNIGKVVLDQTKRSI